MAAARGDRKPCSHVRCPGTMQFGREPLAASAGSTAYRELGWVCGENPDHFTRASELTSGPALIAQISGKSRNDV